MPKSRVQASIDQNFHEHDTILRGALFNREDGNEKWLLCGMVYPTGLLNHKSFYNIQKMIQEKAKELFEDKQKQIEYSKKGYAGSFLLFKQMQFKVEMLTMPEMIEIAKGGGYYEDWIEKGISVEEEKSG